MKERDREKFLVRQAEQTAARKQSTKSRRGSGERYASREEQHARYLDCGPQAWDDKGESPDY